jgi:hypothetical protein
VLGEPIVNLLWRDRSSLPLSEWLSQYRVFGLVVPKRLEVSLSVLYGHGGELPKRDHPARHQLRQLEFPPCSGFAFLVEGKSITSPPGFL